MEEALNQIDEELDIEDVNTFVLYKPDWHLGVIGIVASRLVICFIDPQ